MDVVFSQVLAFCACAFVCFYGANEANRRRDVIITGIYEGIPIELKHRYLMLVNDWMPLKFGLAAIAAGAAAAVYKMSPHAGPWHLAPHEAILIGIGAFGCAFYIFYGLLDFRFCLKVLRKHAR